MTYKETLQYLFSRLPMFQRVGASAFKKDLTNIRALCKALGNPEKEFRSVHVAGTNGKGSSSHLLASVFQAAGYKTGLYTSPHLKEFTERIRVNGDEVSRSFVIDFTQRHQALIEEIRPSFFEITVAMAFEYFSQQNVDVAIIEVGLGGRLDSTNVITPELSLITRIGYDHKDMLGDTLELIAGEKAGIIKDGVPVVISTTQPETENVFRTKAEAHHATIIFADKHFSAERLPEKNAFRILKNRKDHFSELQTPLQGEYQSFNIPGVLQALEILREKFPKADQSAIRKGFAEVVTATGFRGRWQVIGQKPLTICDVGHNEQAIRIITEQLQSYTFEKLHIVLGVVREKDLSAMLRLLPKEGFYYFTEAKVPRALPAGELENAAKKLGLKGLTVPDVNQALQTARKKAGADDLIFVGGSAFVIAELNDL